MLQDFLANRSLGDVRFHSDIFETVENRDFWELFPKTSVLSAAEAALDYSWEPIKATDFMEFKLSGNRRIMEDIHFARRRALTALALGECCENKGRFLPQLVNGIFAVCEESYWGVSAHWFGELGNIPNPAKPYIDLFAGETAEHLSMIHYLLHKPLNDFCPEILARMEYELDRRIKTPYLEHRDFWWMGYQRHTNNWNPWILSNVLTTFLLVERDASRLRCAITKILTELQFFYNGIPDDGGCDEGPGYWNHAGAALFECLYLLKLASRGGIDFFEDEKVKRIAAYPQKVHIAGPLFANFADAHAAPLYTNIPMLYGFARETKQPKLMNLAASIVQGSEDYRTGFSYTSRRTTVRRSIWNAEFDREMMEYPVTDPLHGPLEYLPDLQIATLRRGTFVLCAKGGHNDESHNHNDVGHFVFYDHGEPVLIDPGIGVYTKFTFSQYRYQYIPWVCSCHHNLPVINGVRQEYGKKYRAGAFAADENGIAVSFAQAYPDASGLSELDRSLSLTDDGMVLRDRFSFRAGVPHSAKEMLITALPVSIEQNTAVLDGRYRITANTGIWKQEVLSFEGDTSLQATWGTEALIRLSLTVEHAGCVTVTIKREGK